MSEFDDRANRLAETVRKYIPPCRIKSIRPGGQTQVNDRVIHSSVVIRLSGDNLGAYDSEGLLKAVNGQVVKSSRTRVVIEGEWDGHRYTVTIAC